MGSSPGQIRSLQEIRAVALVASITGLDRGEVGAFDRGGFYEMVGLRDTSGHAFALLAEEGPKAFGSVLIWAAQQPVSELTLMVDPSAGPGDHARRASLLSIPSTTHRVNGAELESVEISPIAAPEPVPDGIEDGIAILRSAGLDVMIEHGVVSGEYLGLEVAQVAPTSDGGEIHVGVGSFDREANRVLHGGSTPQEVLARVIAQVADHRKPGADIHPLGQMARERWLMRHLIDDPSQVGLDSIDEVEPTTPRQGLRVEAPAAGMAGRAGQRTLVVATVGVDVSLPGVIADLTSRETPNEVIVVSVPPMMAPMKRAIELMPLPISTPEVEPPWIG